MNVSSINYISYKNQKASTLTRNVKAQTSAHQKSEITQNNIFYMPAKISFKSNPSYKDFTDWIEKKGINFSDSEEISELIIKSITNKNLIGYGTSQSAYMLDGNRDFIIKIPTNNPKTGPVKIIEDEFPSINLGQTIAKVGNMKICKRQEGIESGIPYSKKIDYGVNLKQIYLDHLYRLEKMPQSAYDDLAKTFSELNKKEKFFDCYNPNNILVDTKNQKFNLVDDLEDALDDDQTNTIMSMLNPLLDIRYMPNLKNDKNAEKIWKETIQKCYIASQKYDLPQPTTNLGSLKNLFLMADYNPYK